MAISYGTYTITEIEEGSQIWTSSVAPTTPDYTFNVSHLTGGSDIPIREGDIILNSYYRYTVLSISSDGTTVLTGNRTSIRGATGAASVTYALIVSNLAIVKDKDGNLSPSTITVTAKSQTGSNAMANYTGRIKIETTTNNSTWTSRINEDAATKTYTIPSDTVAIRCSLYLKGGTTTLLDQQTVPVVSDGIDGTNITITSTSVTYQKGTSGTVKPTGTWKTGVQSVGQGEYLWTRTIVNYSDGSSTEAYSVSRNAVNGTNGTNGKDGKNGTSPTVSSTVTEYAQSTNGTTPPTSGWDTTPKTATAGQYMWTKVTVTYSDSATAVSYTVSKNGTNGTNGINTATVYLYKKGTTAPSVPSGNTTYTFSTKKLTGTLDSWTQEIPTTGSGQCYVTAAVASSNGTTDTIGTGEWSTPIQFNGTNGINGTNGTNGTNGLNQATIFLYKRGTSVTKPTTSVTYTFSTGKLSAEPNSWIRNIPTINGSPCWIVSATAIGNGTTATIAGSNWSDPIKLVEDGVDGKDAYSIVLTNENHTFAGNTTSAIASEIECNVIAYKGTTQIAATIGTITGQPTGMTTEILNNGKTNASFKVKVTTSMVTKNGVLNIPITVDGKSFTKEFTYTLTLDGEKGDKGDRGTNGASQNLLLDAYAPSLAKVDAPSARYFSDASNSTITGQFIAEDNLPDPNATHFVRLTDSSASTKGRGLCFYNNGTPPFLEGNTYRIGCWVRSHSGEPQISFTLGGSLGSWLVKRKVSNTEWEWVEAVHTFGNSNAIDGTPATSYKRLYFYFYNNNVENTSLDMCGFRLERVNVDNGTARNILRKTETLDGWTTTNGATINNGIVTFPASTSDVFRGLKYPSSNINYSIVRNKYCIISMKVKANIGERCCVNVESGFTDTETNNLLQKYKTQYIYFTGTGEWQTICTSELLTDYSFTSGSGSGTIDFDNCWFRINLYAQKEYHNSFELKEPQLCLGTTATSWSRAPEDVDEVIDNIEIGGRNLLKGSDVTNTSITTYLLGGTSTQVIPSGTVITLSVQIDADDVVWASSGNRRIGVASSIVKDGGGNQYIEAWAAMTGRTGIGIDKTFDTSFHGRVKSTYTLQGELPLDKAFNLYVQSVTSGTVSVSRPKLEIGNKATDWTPAPEDVNADIEEAKKVATNYLSTDNTGIMVANMKDGEQLPSKATGRNVFIDNDSVDIRNGQRVLASFSGEDTKFYDVNSDNKEVASFGANGVRVGNEDEQHFIVDSESMQAINENGSPIFSVTSTGGTITSDVVVAKGFNSQASDYDVILNGGISSSENTFYPKDLYAFITIQNSRSEFTSFEVSINDGEFEDVPFTRTSYTPEDSELVVRSRHHVDLPRFLFHYGTEEYMSYQLEGVYTSDKGNIYRYSGDIHISYDGQRTITMHRYQEHFYKMSGDAEDDIELDWWNGYLWGDIYSSLGYTKAPAMTFGTRGNGGTIAPLSVVIGQDLYANNESQLSIGKYNLENNDGLAFVIGNGTDDANRSNAFTVDWDGNAEVAGDLKVANNAEIVNDISVGGDVNITGAIKSNNKPMFKVVNRAFTAIGIGSGRAYTTKRTISIDGYTPVSIGGINVTNNMAYNASSYADASWCVVPAFWIDFSDTIDDPDIRTDALYFYIWNMNSSKGVNVDFNVRIVYIATDALGNN